MSTFVLLIAIFFSCQMETAVKQDLDPLIPASPAPQTKGVSTRYPTDVLLQYGKTATAGSDERGLLHQTPPTSERHDSPAVSPHHQHTM